MRTRRALSVAVLVTLTAALAAVGGPSAQADAPVPTELVLAQTTSTAYTPVFHDHVAGSLPGTDVVDYAATLTSSGVPLAGQQVVLQRDLAPGTTWQDLGTATTDANGVVDFATPVKGNATYQAVYAGDLVLASATSPSVPLAAMRDFNARVGHTASGVYYLHGNINPGWGRRVVSWQRRTCDTCAWRTVEKERSTRSGGWLFPGSYSRHGKTWWFRAKLDGTSSFMTSTSSMLEMIP